MNEDAIADLLAYVPEDEARSLLIRLSVPPRVINQFERIASVMFARALLAKGLCRRSIAYQVAARYEVAPRTAYRRIDEALGIGPL